MIAWFGAAGWHDCQVHHRLGRTDRCGGLILTVW